MTNPDPLDAGPGREAVGEPSPDLIGASSVLGLGDDAAQAVPEPPEPSETHETHSVASANFLRFWTGQTLAQFGTRLAAVAMPVLAVHLLHASEAQLGYLNAAHTAAFLLVGLPAGAWVDRWFKRKTMIVADIVRLAAVLAIPLLWFAGALQLWHLYLVGGLVGIATVFFDVAYQSYVPILVPGGDVGRANSRLETTAQLATTAGPALGGLLMKVVSAPVVLLADAFGYLASLVFLLLTRDTEHLQRDVSAAHGSLRADIAEGLGFVLKHPALVRITASTGISNLFATIVSTLLPILTLRMIGVSPFVFGLILTCGSIGGTIGAALTPWLQRKVATAPLIRASSFVAGVFFLLNPLAGLVSSKLLATAMLMVAELGLLAGVLVYNITQVSLRQRLTPKHLLGRMNASIRFIVWGIMPLAALAGGWLGATFGVQITMLVAAIGAMAAALPVWNLARHIPAEA